MLVVRVRVRKGEFSGTSHSKQQQVPICLIPPNSLARGARLPATDCGRRIYYREKNLGVREVQIFVKNLAVNSGHCAILEYAALPM